MSRTVMFLIIFVALCLQMAIAYFQAKDYHKALQKIKGKGITGVGHTKGIIHPGQILLLSYDPDQDKIIQCLVMRGLTVFARFKEDHSYNGLSLEEVKKIALEKDAQQFKRLRKKHPYDPDELTKKKHALLQAVDAINKREKKEVGKITVSRSKNQSSSEKSDLRFSNI